MIVAATPEVALTRLGWREPLEVLAPFAKEPFAFALLSDGSAEERWSYVGCRPVATFGDLGGLRAARAAAASPAPSEGPPFQGGAVGLAGYEWSATLEPSAPQRRRPGWPDLAGGVFEGLVAFDHHRRETWAVGRGADPARAAARAEEAADLVRAARPLPAAPLVGGGSEALGENGAYPRAVAAVVAAISEGEIFQANIARAWAGRLAPGVGPFPLAAALHALSPAPMAAYLRLPEAALVSRSPERFLGVSPEGLVRTHPVKGTRPRGAHAEEDARLARELTASAKDRAENLMIVDVMRNDLARACTPGTVKVEDFCSLRSFSNVHHLVSTVRGRLAPGEDALSLFAAAFPPASVTGAPKLQAMTVIARHEPPRGPYCGSLFRLGFDGGFDSSVLIRTVALDREVGGGWRWEARAGAGITADSDPDEEDAEAVQKAAAVLAAFAP